MLADSQLCYVGVNTNSASPVTGGNTEASPRLFQHNLRSGLILGAIKVSDTITLCRQAVFCVSFGGTFSCRFSVTHNAVLPVRYAQQRAVDFSHEPSISGARSAL